jgi:glycerol-3-phosphate dehydrogenase
MGRCQGSFCGPNVAQIIAAEKNIPVTEVMKMADNSRILLGDNREGI